MSNRKKILSVVLALILALGSFTIVPFGASAAVVETAATGSDYTDADGNIFRYEVEDNSIGGDEEYDYDFIVTITGIENVSSEITIPGVLPYGRKDRKVNYMELEAFSDQNCPIPLTKVDFSQVSGKVVDEFLYHYGFQMVGHYEDEDYFYEGRCAELESIVLPEDSSYYMDGAYCRAKNTNNELFHFPGELPDNCIELNGGLLFYTVTEDLFYYTRAKNLSGDVVIPERIDGHLMGTEIDDALQFIDMPGLTSVTVPEGVGTAFKNCENLTTITLQGEYPVIGRSSEYGGCFIENCPSLTAFITDENSYLHFEDGLLYGDNNVLYAVLGKKGAYTVPDGFVSIYDGAFRNCPELTSITLPDSVRDIGRAFSYLENLKEIVLSEGISYFVPEAFAFCTSLEKLNIPSTVKVIEQGAFYDCTNLKELVIPESVVEASGRSFFGSGIETVYGYYGTLAEKIAGWLNYQFKPLGPATSDEVEVKAPEGTSYSVVDMHRAATSDEATPDQTEPLPEGSVILNSYDIKLRDMDGNPIQPESPVTIRIHCYDPAAKVYRREADGSLTDMHAVYQAGILEFTVDHFSLYLVIVPEERERLLGDVDGDGEITITDATFIQRVLAEMSIPIAFEAAVADVDGDNDITVADATSIQRMLAKMDSIPAIGQPIRK